MNDNSVNELRLPSGLLIDDPFERVLRYCRTEYDYYDAVPRGHPDEVEPVDVLATVGLNSRLDTATKVRTVHRAMATTVNPVLRRIPPEATIDDAAAMASLHELITAAMTSKFVLLATATKVLHRKRPALVPIMDSVVVAHYVQGETEKALLSRAWTSRPAAAEVAQLVVGRLRQDLAGRREELEGFRVGLRNEGFLLTTVRILDVLVWSSLETSGAYR